MKDVITDTHFDNPDRRGRLMAFIARAYKDNNKKISGIACEEYTAVFIDTNMIATVFGGQPAYDDNAFFVKIDCAGNNAIEQCTNGNPLNWKQDSTVVKVYHVQADTTGSRYFDLRNFSGNANYANSGGIWEDWWVENGVFHSRNGSALNCLPNAVAGTQNGNVSFKLFPNPAINLIRIEFETSETAIVDMKLIDLQGKEIQNFASGVKYLPGNYSNFYKLNNGISKGVYLCQISLDGIMRSVQKLVIE